MVALYRTEFNGDVGVPPTIPNRCLSTHARNDHVLTATNRYYITKTLVSPVDIYRFIDVKERIHPAMVRMVYG
jgi:hypothetical protein